MAKILIAIAFVSAPFFLSASDAQAQTTASCPGNPIIQFRTAVDGSLICEAGVANSGEACIEKFGGSLFFGRMTAGFCVDTATGFTVAVSAPSGCSSNGGDGLQCPSSGGQAVSFTHTDLTGFGTLSFTEGNGGAVVNGSVSTTTGGASDTTPPVVQSIVVSGTPSVFATAVDFTVTFDEAVTGVTADDFALALTGTAAGTIGTPTGSGTTYTVSVTGITGDGNVGLNLSGSTDIVDADGNGNGTNGSVAAFTGATYTTSTPPTISLSVGATTPGEGDGTVTVTATASVAVDEDVTVPLSFTGTGDRDTDYTFPAGDTITILSGATSGTANITLLDDLIDELDETIIIDMGAPSGSSATESGVQQQTVTIGDNDATPTLSVSDVTVTEGDSGTVSATFTVTASGASDRDMGFAFATADGTGAAGTDYTSFAASTFISAGLLSTSVGVQVSGDAVVEGDETFNMTISSPSNATIADDTGVATITNDDTAAVTIANVTVNENDGTATVTATLDNAVQGGFAVDVSTADNTATTADGDYAAVTNQTLTFAGTASETETFSVTLGGDTKVELDEIIDIAMTNLTPVSADAGDISITDTATVTLTNDDQATVTIADVSGNEDDGAITVTVAVDVAVDGGFSVFVSSQDDTAIGGDYTSVIAQAVIFAGTAGETQTFTVTPTVDATAEPDETLNLIIISKTTGTVSSDDIDTTDTGTVTILNDDDISASVNDPSVAEGDSGNANLVFTVSLDAPAPTGGATVDYATSSGTANSGPDFSVATGTAVFNAGETSATVTVLVAGDTFVEQDETLTLTVSNPTGTDVIIGDASGTGTITNDDTAAVTIANVTVNENDGTATVTATLDNAIQGGFAVDVSTADNTATTADGDYAAVTNQTLTFAGTASETETFSVTLGGDTKVEADEIIDIAMTNLVPVSADAGDISITDTATVTLTNDDQATVTIADRSGNEDDGSITLTVVVDNAVDGGFDVNVSTADGTATTADSDYTPVVAQTLSFTGTAGENETFTITPTADATAEADETVLVSMAGLSPAVVSSSDIDITDGATVTILSDDSIGISVNDPNIGEGDAGSTDLIFTVSLDAPAPAGGASVLVTTSDGTATAGSDYNAVTSTLNFTEGQTSKTATVVMNGDSVVEANETLTLTLSNPTGTNVVINDATGTGTIANDDSAVVTIADVSANENNGTATVTVAVDNAVDGGFSVNVRTIDSTATTADGDYTAVVGQTLTFAGTAGEEETFSVTLGADTKVEADEAIDIAMSSLLASTVDGSNFNISDTATLTITNDDTATVTIADVSGNEDDGAITVTVALDAAVDGGFDVDVSTLDGTATVADSDYSFINTQTLTFSGTASETETFTVTPTADATGEPDEALSIIMTGLLPNTVSSGAIDVSDTGTVTILNDDSIAVSVNDPSVVEGDSGNVNLVFTVSLSAPAPAGGATVDVATSNGTANGGDYTGFSGTVSFSAGDTSETVLVSVAGDEVVEFDETVILTLSNPTGTDVTIGDATGTGTITNDDTASVTISPVFAQENGTFTLEATLSASVQGGLSFNVATADNTALAGVDYVAVGTVLTFLGDEGETQTATITVTDDNIVEANEVIDVNVSGLSATGADTADITLPASTTVTIANNDTATLSFVNSDSFEATSSALILLRVDNPVDGGFSIDVSTADGTATTADSDYTALTSATASFAGTASETQSVFVTVIDDAVPEPNESINLSMSNVVPSTVAASAINFANTGTLTILNDDNISMSVNDATVAEGDSGSSTLQFTVSLSAPALAGGAMVEVSTMDGTASSSSDYTAITSQVVSIAGGASSATVDVTVNGDQSVEVDETFALVLSNPAGTGIVISDGTGTGTITNDDNAELRDIARLNPVSATTNADTLTFRVAFQSIVTGVDAGDFEVVGGAGAVSNVAATAASNVYEVTVSGNGLDNHAGTIGLALVSSGLSILDGVGNPIAGGAPTGSNQTYSVDTVAPTVTSIARSAPTAETVSDDTLVFEVTFSEFMPAVSQTDFVVNGGAGAITSVTPTSGTSTMVTVSGNGLADHDGVIGLDVAASPSGTFDSFGNALAGVEPTTDETYTIDNTGPQLERVVRLTPAQQTTNLDRVIFQASFDEAVTSFSTADFAVVGGAGTVTDAIMPSSTTAYVTVSGSGLDSHDGEIGLTVSGTPTATDAVGNVISAAATVSPNQTYILDNTAPRVTAIQRGTPADEFVNVSTVRFNVSYSEAVTGAGAPSFSVNGSSGSISAVSNNSTASDVIVIGLTDGTVGLDVVGTGIVDAAGNALETTEPPVDDTYTIDSVAPTVVSVVRTTPTNETTNADSLTFTVTFSEDMGNVDATDFESLGITGAAVAVSPQSDSVYDVTLSGSVIETGAGTVSLGFASGQDIEDINGVAALASAVPSGANESYSLDNTAPTLVSVTRLSPAVETTNADAVTFLIEYSEELQSFFLGDLTVTGAGSISAFRSTGLTTYEIDVSGNGLDSFDGVVGIDVVASPGFTADFAGNLLATGEPATDETYTLDNSAPTVVITAPSVTTGSVSGAFDVTFTFSEDVTGFEVGDITVGNGAASGFSGAGTVYTATITPASEGQVSVDVAAAVAQDAIGNDNIAATQFSVVEDQTAPTVTITPPSGPVGQTFTVTLTFSEPVTDLEVGEITVTNGTPSNLVTTDGGTTWRVDITADGNGDVGIGVAAAAVVDDAGNPSDVVTPISVAADLEAPVVTLTGPTDTITTDFVLTISASEDITGLAIEDLTVIGGTLANLSGSGDTFTVDITPVLGEVVTVTLGAGLVEDLAGNVTAAASEFSVQAGSPETEFAANADAIIDTVQSEAQRRLSNEMSANSGMMQRSLDRFIDSTQDRERAFRDVAFDVTGAAELTLGQSFTTNGTFFGQNTGANGVTRTAMGQFDIAVDEDDSWTAQISGRITHEWSMSEDTRVGYFYGGSLSRGDISGTYEGDSSSVGVIVGGYGLTRLSENVFADAYVGIGYSQTELDFADNTLSLDGDYGAFSYYAGLSVTGSIMAANGVEFRPALAIDYGRTDIGVVGLQANAFGLTSLVEQDFGAVSVLEISLSPEMIVPVTSAQVPTEFRIEPRLVCRFTTGRVDEDECGAGLALGLDAESADGRIKYGFGLDYQDTGSSRQSSADLFLEMQF